MSDTTTYSELNTFSGYIVGKAVQKVLREKGSREKFNVTQIYRYIEDGRIKTVAVKLNDGTTSERITKAEATKWIQHFVNLRLNKTNKNDKLNELLS